MHSTLSFTSERSNGKRMQAPPVQWIRSCRSRLAGASLCRTSRRRPSGRLEHHVSGMTRYDSMQGIAWLQWIDQYTHLANTLT